MDEMDLIRAEMRARAESDRGLRKAIWNLALGEPEKGLAELQRYLAEVHGEGPVSAAECAVLAGDWERASREAIQALGTPTDRYVPGYRSYLRATLALYAGARPQAEAFLKETEEYVSVHSKIGSHPPGALDLLRGLFYGSPDQTAAGLDALLDWHLRRSRQPGEIFNSANAVVSLEAMRALLLAHRLGMTVTVPERYRAASVPLMVVYLKEFEGRPVAPSTKIEGTFDLVGGSWLRQFQVIVPDPPSAVSHRRRPSPSGPKHRAQVDEETGRQSLRLHEEDKRANPWISTGLALALGNAERARQHLAGAAAEAGALWRNHRLPSGDINQNYVMDHFRLALLAGEGFQVPLAQLAEFDQAMKAKGIDLKLLLHSPTGHLRLIKDLLLKEFKGMAELRDHALAALHRVALVGLVERDPKGLSEGLNGMLQEHADRLGRIKGLFDPVCRAAAEIAAVARMAGVLVDVDASFRDFPTPFKVDNLPEHKGKVAMIRCDLLGEGLWNRGYPDKRTALS